MQYSFGFVSCIAAAAVMSQEVLSLKAELKEKDEEIAALKQKLAQLEKVRRRLNVVLSDDNVYCYEALWLS